MLDSLAVCHAHNADGAGAEGVKVLFNKLVGELKGTMTMCGAPTLKDITRDTISL